MPDRKTVKLNDGTDVPLLGYGTAKRRDPVSNVKMAFAEAGLRHFDCGERYGNEDDVGRALQQLQVARDEIFVTTKCKLHSARPVKQ